MKLELNYQSAVLNLPMAVAEKLDNAGETDLKVLIFLAAHPEYTEDFDSAKSAVALNISDREIEQSVAFWRGAGVLKSGKTSKKALKTPQKQENTADEPADRENDIRSGAPIVASRVKDLPVYTGAEIEQLMKERKKLKNLLKDCQNILGKVFNVSESNKIIALSGYLQLPDEYILLLCSYCAGRDRASVPYVVSEAVRLHDSGITDYRKLEEYIAQREKQNDFNNFIRHLSGIGDRVLTPYEEKTFAKWAGFGYPKEVISCAYRISVDSTAKIVFKHMDKILQAWHDAGVKTLEDAKDFSAKHTEEMKKLYAPKKDAGKSGASKAEKKEDFVSFDTDEFFAAALKKSEEELKSSAGEGQ